MARTFAYVRVSTAGQTTENQIQEIKAAGFTVTPRRVVSETVSGSSAIEQRPGFMRLMDRLEQDDVLIVTKLDRPSRNAIDFAATVDGTDKPLPDRRNGLRGVFRATPRPTLVSSLQRAEQRTTDTRCHPVGRTRARRL